MSQDIQINIAFDSIGEIPYTIHLHIWRAAIFDMCSILSHRVDGWPHIHLVNRPVVYDKLTQFAHRFVHRCQIYMRKKAKTSGIELLISARYGTSNLLLLDAVIVQQISAGLEYNLS